MDKTMALVTLGCKVNQYDTQAMRELLAQAGYREVPFEEKADVYVVNTCTVTATGDQKSRQMIGRAHHTNPEALIVVAGCYAQRAAEEAAAIPGVGLVLGTQDRGKIAQLVAQAAAQKGGARLAVDTLEKKGLPYEGLRVTQSQAHTRANLKIQEGCRQFCTYCIIPYVRGPLRSRAVEDAAQEAERLVAAGHREIVLTGIHLTSYGLDGEEKGRFKGEQLLELLGRLEAIPGLARVRMGSVEPQLLHSRFIEGLRLLKKLCPHWHVSLQSGSAGVLSRMRRTYGPEEYLAALERLRAAFPGVAITTDVMCGFPGETEQEHRESLAFVERAAFSRIHVFTYSPRAGTPAAQMPLQVPRAEKKRRTHEMLRLGERLEAAYMEGLLDTVQEVLFETPVEGMADTSAGYTPSYVHVRCTGAAPGELAKVKIISRQGEFLTGQAVKG